MSKMKQVLCLRDDWGHKPVLKRWPVAGMIYTVRAINFVEAVRGKPAMPFFLLEEVRNPKNPARWIANGGLVEPMFDATWFREVRRTDISALLASVHQQERLTDD